MTALPFAQQIQTYAVKLHNRAIRLQRPKSWRERLGDEIDEWCFVAYNRGLADWSDLYDEEVSDDGQ